MMSREQQLGARGTTLKAGHVSPCARSQSAIDQIRGRIPALDVSQAPSLASTLWSWIRYLTLNHFSHQWKIVRRVESVHVIAISKPWISREMVGNYVCGLLLSTCSPGWANPSSGSRPSQVRASPWSQQAWKTSLKRNSELGLATSLWSHWRTSVVGGMRLRACFMMNSLVASLIKYLSLNIRSELHGLHFKSPNHVRAGKR